MSRFARYALLAAGLLGLTQAQAQDDELLRVEEAFALTTQVTGRDSIQLQWKIADGYYLYRTRMSTRSSLADLNLAPLELPPGEPKNDEFLGQVEVYHGKATATQPLKPGPDVTTAEFAVTIQGCHEREPKICYPPHTTKLSLPLPPPAPGVAATEPAGAGLLRGPAAATPPGALSSALNQLGKPAMDAPMDTGTAPAAPGEEKLPLPPEQAFVFETIATSPTELLARWTMPKGYYLYRDKTKLSVPADSGVRLGTPRWPVGTSHKDEHYGDVTVYFDQVELPVDLGREDGKPARLKLQAEFQGCENDGVCYPIMTRTVEVELPQASAAQLDMARAKLATSAPAATTAPASGDAEDQSEEQRLAAQLSSNRLLALLSFFGFGLLLAFTPCVFPMLPILSGIIAGAGENVSTRRAFVLSTVYVLASCVVFTIAGVIAGLASKNLQAAFQISWVLFTFSALFVALAFSMFGFFELQLPQSWQTKFAAISNRQQGGSLLGVAVMGLFSALIVGPCVAPPLAGAVLYIAQTNDPVFGGIALFVLSLGMGMPLIAVGTGAGYLLPRAGAWMDTVKAVFGVCFLWMALWISSRVMSEFWVVFLAACLLIGSGVYMGALERIKDGASGWFKLWKTLGLIQLLIGTGLLLGLAQNHSGARQPSSGAGQAATSDHLPFRTIKTVADVEAQLKQGKPVMLDFYADWCVSCKEMEKFTFTKPEVHAALQPYTLLKADVTANDAEDQALLKQFGLVGPPVTIFFGADGKERRAQRLTGFESADKFVARVAKAAGR